MQDAAAIAAAQALAEEEELQTALAISLTEAEQGGFAGAVSSAAPAVSATESVAEPARAVSSVSQATDALKSAMEELNRIVCNCAEAGSPFLDPDFAPGPQVLYANGKSRRQDSQGLAIVQHFTRHGEEIRWRRPGEILQRPDDLKMEFASMEEMYATMHQFARMVEWRVFQSVPHPEDISQGGLGNCWFCGSLAAVTERPSLVKWLFVDDFSRNGDLNPTGVYVVRLNDGGEWKYIILDDLLPCDKLNMLAFSGARHNQLWVPLVEKAYAKLRGNYEAIEGGNPAEGLRLLTGWPSIVQNLQVRQSDNSGRSHADSLEASSRLHGVCDFAGEDLLWVRLVSAHTAGLIMCGSCGHVDGISPEHYRSVGLSPSHCYSIVQVASAKDGNVRLLQLRNPWGTGRKWTGSFSDNDKENWTDELKRELSVVDLGNEGIFWMQLEDVRRYFTSVTICPFREGWAEARRTAVFPARVVDGQQPAFVINVEGVTESLISLMQHEERASPMMMTADLGLVLFRLPDHPSSDEYVSQLPVLDATPRRVHDTLVCDMFLGKQGQRTRVLAVPLSFNHRSAEFGFGVEKRFTFATFSSVPLEIQEVAVPPETVRNALVEHIRMNGSSSGHAGALRVRKAEDAGLAVLVENPTPHQIIFETRLSEVFNMCISRSVETGSGAEMETVDCVPPMHGMIIFVAAALPNGHRWRYSQHCNSTMGDQTLHVPALAAPKDALHTPFRLGAGQRSTSRPLGLQGAAMMLGPRGHHEHERCPQQ